MNTSTFKDETTLKRAALTLDQGGGRQRCLAVQGLLRVFQIIVGVVEGDKVAEGPLAVAPGRRAHTRIRSLRQSNGSGGQGSTPCQKPSGHRPSTAQSCVTCIGTLRCSTASVGSVGLVKTARQARH